MHIRPKRQTKADIKKTPQRSLSRQSHLIYILLIQAWAYGGLPCETSELLFIAVKIKTHWKELFLSSYSDDVDCSKKQPLSNP